MVWWWIITYSFNGLGKEKERINGIESEGKEDQSFFLLASYLGTAVVSVRTHARTLTQHTHTTHTTRVQTNLQLHSDLKTASFVEITEILRFRRRRARHDPIVASRVRDRCLEPVQAETGCCTAHTGCDTNVCDHRGSNAGGQTRHREYYHWATGSFAKKINLFLDFSSQ